MTDGVRRSAAYVEEGSRPFFAWRHDDPRAPATDLVAVICPPIGSEYTRSHRSIRHLADRLARAGIPAVRFDYHGTGDSPGTDLDPDRLGAWLENIRAACDLARRWSGRSRVVLAGVRMGATLAALASNEIDPELLVLWNPPVKGKPYVRELQAIAMTAARAGDSDGALEAAGFAMTAETLASLKAIDLLHAPVRARAALIVTRDDLTPDETLATRLGEAGIATETMPLPGWNGMMADHQHTVVPEAALGKIVEWIRGRSRDGGNPSLDPRLRGDDSLGGDDDLRGKDAIRLAFSDGATTADVEERLCHFGIDQRLFGVLTRLDDSPSRPAIVLFNGGAVHHVGPNRLYVTLARSLAALGFACLRFDLEGIGDSVLQGPGRENHPYPEHATRDARAALAFLRERFGYRRFVALGLCSGAHTAFHSALQLEGEGIEELMLINPYAFYWKEGMSLDVASTLHDAHQYKKSMRDPGRWLKLLRGDVNFRRLIDVAIAYPKTLGMSYVGAVCERLMPEKAPPLARDLRRLFARRRRVTLLVSEGDPGGEMLMAEARWTARRGMRDGSFRLETIAGGDHTFTQSRPRRALIERVAAHLQPCLAQTPRA